MCTAPAVGFRGSTSASALLFAGLRAATLACVEKVGRTFIAMPSDLAALRLITSSYLVALVITLKTAKSLGLMVSSTLLARADVVIE